MDIVVLESDRKGEVSQGKERNKSKNGKCVTKLAIASPPNSASSRSERICLEEPYEITVHQNILMCVGE